jgi:SlyX protein
MSDDRITALEIRIAHQDQTVAELNEVVTTQWRKIEALERQMGRLREEFQNSQNDRGGDEPPPPHY